MSPCQNLGDYSEQGLSPSREMNKRIIPFLTRQCLRRTFSIDMPYSLQRLKEKWEASIETGHWPSARAQGNAHGGRYCFLVQLPTELLLKIASYLSAVPRACLALTCRRLFLVDDVALNSELLHFSPDFALLFKHYQNEYNFATDRWQLMRLLENRRWLACSRCLKLHMVASFPQRERKKRPEDRTCSLGDLAGVVELCPCIKLSFRGKMDLVDLLRTRQQTLTALATQVGASSLERFCWHSCVMNYGSSEMKIRVLPELDKTDMLKVRVEYRLTIEAGQLGKEESMIPLLGCAHRAVDLWLATVCNTYVALGRTASHISACSICNTSLICPRKGPLLVDEGSGHDVYDFYIEKCLGPGNGSVPDHQWAVQRIHPAGDRRTVGDCDERYLWSPRKCHICS
ncbi:F-box domain protein [Aspergillus flavus]|nr:F-box domain protein [Aspergillus flavus]